MRIRPRFLWLALLLAHGAAAQTLVQSPALLNTIPRGATVANPYWQHLVITLSRDPVPGNSIHLSLPAGVEVADTDGDGNVEDEISIDDALGGYQAATGSSASQLVLVSPGGGAAGPVHVQFPVTTPASPTAAAVVYGLANFSRSGEQPIPAGTLTLTYAEPFELELAGFTGLLGEDRADTTSNLQGDQYPTQTAALFSLPLPDLLSDQAGSLAGNILRRNGAPFGNGNDGDDVRYRFWFSARDTLSRVDSTTATPARSQGQVLQVNEGSLVMKTLDLTSLAEGTYYLYLTSDLTGSFPLARSRGLSVRHRPVVLEVGRFESGDDDYLDSGLLLDFDKGQPGRPGRARDSVTLEFAVADYDDSAAVKLFYATAATLDTTFVRSTGTSPSRVVTGLTNAAHVDSAASLKDGRDTRLNWRVLRSDSTQVDSGSYYIYAVATDGKNLAIGRSTYRYRVSHSPLLRLDVRQDFNVETGGEDPQRYYPITWNQDNGVNGDVDRDHSAIITLYYSADSTFQVPGGTQAIGVAAADSLRDTHVIADSLSEDRDGRLDNQHLWDLWTYTNPDDRGVPRAGVPYYVYGAIRGGGLSRLVRWEDSGGRARRLVFSHSPHLRLKAPLEALTAQGGESFQVAWEARDVDDRASLWVLLTSEEAGRALGESTTYGQLVADGRPEWVANSSDGSLAASTALSEGVEASFAVQPARLQRLLDGTAQALADGVYYVYVVMQDQGGIASQSPAQRAPGLVSLSGLAPAGGQAVPAIEVLPAHLVMAAPRDTATFELHPNTAGRSADLLSCFLSVDTLYFRVVDQNATQPGIQPFALAGDLPGLALADTLKAGSDSTTAGKWLLDLVYFEQGGTLRFDGTQPLATFRLAAKSATGPVPLRMDHSRERQSAIYQEGSVVALLPPSEVGRITLVPRATLSGQVKLQGRTRHLARVTFSLRDRNNLVPVSDALFLAANDVDSTQSGLQDSTDADGNFSLVQVPSGDFQLAVHLDQYLDGYYPGLQVNPGDQLTGIDPTFLADGKTRAESLLGGDVTGYVDTSGASLPDNQVDQLDVDFVVAYFGQRVNASHAGRLADIDGDSLVWVADLNMVAANFNRAGVEPVYKPAGSLGPAGVALELRAGEQELEAEVVAEGLEGLRAYGFKVVYDPAQLALVDQAQGQVFAGRPAVRARRQEPGILALGQALMGRVVGVAGHQSLARLRFAPQPGVSLEKATLRLEEVQVVDGGGARSLAGVQTSLPGAYRLLPNFPNPFNPETALRVELPRAGQVAVEVYDAAGQRVRSLVEGWLPAGVQTFTWDGRDERGREVGSGVYLARLRAGGAEDLRKMLLLR
ncbi:MAG: T9SS type A sorting domain-containing protein [Candidatus Latescibacteria bacterium]|nr:T9SS type A sorting domain-containing protein [Candidatus Latescibacterota bacterium]